MKFHLKFRTDRVVAVGLLIALGLGFWLSQRPHPPHGKLATAAVRPARRVKVVAASKRQITVFADGVGTVRSRRQTQIASRVLAEVKEIRRQPGDAVEAGDVLVVLDSLDLRARVEQAEASLRSVEEALKEAQTDFDRKQKLLEKDAVTQQEYDIAKFALSATTARRGAAEKALEEARIQLGYATIAAPFKGVIFEKHADPGDLATPGKPLLGLYDPEQLRLEALVEEVLLWKLKVKDELRVQIDALPEAIVGQVSEAVPAVDPSTRTGTVKIDLPSELDLRPGMFGRARIAVSRRDAIVVPAPAVIRRGQLELVFTVKPGEASGEKVARMLLVRTGHPVEHEPAGKDAGPQPDGSLTEIVTGLAAGEAVVAAGAEDLRDGDSLEVAEAERTTHGAKEAEGSRQ